MDVEIPNIGTLRTSLKAAKAINGKFGSLLEAARRIDQSDFDAFVFVVAAGLNLETVSPQIEKKVYDIGTKELYLPLATFLTALANGGKKPVTVAEGDELGEA